MKRYKNILFDLDGTLLPIDYEQFLSVYLKEVAIKFTHLGYDGKRIADCVMQATGVVMNNDGKRSNEKAFWQRFLQLAGADGEAAQTHFMDFYENEYDRSSVAAGINPLAAKAVEQCRKNGMRVFLATAPYFPKLAIEKRVRWAGLDPADFECLTTYDNCTYCKPNPLYFQELLDRCGLKAEETLMVGNDVEQDLPCQEVGIDCWLLKEGLLNEGGKAFQSTYLTDWETFYRTLCQMGEAEEHT